ncbi:MFS transporter [Microbacterium sp. YY-03]|uniref:MFS transporter n=1 Tax=Microbacterium sp. YY-03 TaxID=3421636 RepID=UPI003D181425
MFWVYLETKSLLASGVIGGAYMLLVAVFGMVFGAIVDHLRKKTAMLISSLTTLTTYAIGLVMFSLFSEATLLDWRGPWFWIFVIIVLIGSVVENMRNIALSTTVTLLVPPDRRDKANGLVGTISGIGFLVTSVFSGLSVGLLGMHVTILIAVIATAVALVHLLVISIPEPVKVRSGEGRVNFRGAIPVILAVPGLLALLLFTTLMPAAEAAEQTILQRVIPYEKQGRVFGFAMTVEVSAAPITAFLIGPIAEFIVVPYMNSDAGQVTWGWLLGEGEARGVALVFVLASLIMLIAVLLAFMSRPYRNLSKAFAAAPPPAVFGEGGESSADARASENV